MALRTEAILRIAIETQKIMARYPLPYFSVRNFKTKMQLLYTSLLPPYIVDKDNTASLL